MAAQTKRFAWNVLSGDATFGQVLTPEWWTGASKMQRDTMADLLGSLFGRVSGSVEGLGASNFGTICEITVARGLGFSTTASDGSALYVPAPLEGDTVVALNAPDLVNPRWDVLVLQPPTPAAADTVIRRIRTDPAGALTTEYLPAWMDPGVKFVTVRQGTPAAVPVAPALQAGDVPVAAVYVRPGSSVYPILSADIHDIRRWLVPVGTPSSYIASWTDNHPAGGGVPSDLNENVTDPNLQIVVPLNLGFGGGTYAMGIACPLGYVPATNGWTVGGAAAATTGSEGTRSAWIEPPAVCYYPGGAAGGLMDQWTLIFQARVQFRLNVMVGYPGVSDGGSVDGRGGTAAVSVYAHAVR